MKNKHEFDQIMNKYNNKINPNREFEKGLKERAERQLDFYLKELTKKYKKWDEECKKSREERERQNPPEVLFERKIEQLKENLNKGGLLFDFRQFRLYKDEKEYEILEYLDGYCCAGLSHKVTYDSFTKLINWYIEHEVSALWNTDNKELRDQFEQLIIDELNNVIETVKIR